MGSCLDIKSFNPKHLKSESSSVHSKETTKNKGEKYLCAHEYYLFKNSFDLSCATPSAVTTKTIKHNSHKPIIDITDIHNMQIINHQYFREK